MVFSRRKFLLGTALSLVASTALAAPAKKRAVPKKPAARKPKNIPVKPIKKVAQKPLQPDQDFMPRIHEAWAMLASREAGYTSLLRVILSYHWLLAVQKLEGGPIEIIRMDERYRTEDANFTISAPVDNGINTRFRVDAPDGYVVLAQKRVVHDDARLVEATYTAYSVALDTASMLKTGIAYLEGLIATAFESLTTLAVPSIAFPRNGDRPARLVADVISRRSALVLFITEHIDPLHARAVGVRQCVDEVLITLAANGPDAYRYAVSSVGARGLPQFMNATYDQVRALYPAAQLNGDFIAGMQDQANAAKSALLHFDMELSAIPAAVLADGSLDLKDRQFLINPKNYRTAAAFIAAGYNWNAERVARVYEKTKRLSKGLPDQTQLYVDIQRQVADYLGLPA